MAAEQKPAGKSERSELKVTAPVAVLPLKAGGERYVYRGGAVGDEYTKEGVEHARSVGLIG